jgi:hypothetical protein
MHRIADLRESVIKTLQGEDASRGDVTDIEPPRVRP